MNKMRPAESNEVDDLCLWKPLLLFNKSLFGPAYVDSLVFRSPTLIKSKGGKGLPLELWLSILAFAVAEGPEAHDYALVRPFKLETRKDGGKVLTSQKFKRWTSFGTIPDAIGVEDYNLYLAHPDKDLHSHRNPFRNREYGHPVSIPTELLDSKINFLQVRLTVQDVIKYLEGGGCQLCCGDRTLGGYCVGIEVAYRWFEGFESLHEEIVMWYDCFGLPILCPLCVGREYSEKYLQRFERDWAYATHHAEYFSWLETTIQEQGFRTALKSPLPRASGFGLRPSGAYLSSD
ncbi:hypothetical protein ACHAP5_006205 [Fusarium lateritium]